MLKFGRPHGSCLKFRTVSYVPSELFCHHTVITACCMRLQLTKIDDHHCSLPTAHVHRYHNPVTNAHGSAPSACQAQLEVCFPGDGHPVGRVEGPVWQRYAACLNYHLAEVKKSLAETVPVQSKPYIYMGSLAPEMAIGPQ